jgi:hypothetical protein
MLEHRPGEIRSSRGGTSKLLPPDITKKQSHVAQTLSRNQDVVEPPSGFSGCPTTEKLHNPLVIYRPPTSFCSVEAPPLPGSMLPVIRQLLADIPLNDYCDTRESRVEPDGWPAPAFPAWPLLLRQSCRLFRQCCQEPAVKLSDEHLRVEPQSPRD